MLKKIAIEDAVLIHSNMEYLGDTLSSPQIHRGRHRQKEPQDPSEIDSHRLGIAISVPKDHPVRLCRNDIRRAQGMDDILYGAFPWIQRLKSLGINRLIDDHSTKITSSNHGKG